MFMSEVLICCALIVAAQAVYAPDAYGSGAVLGGYAAHIQPAATVSVRSYGHGVGPSYGQGVNSNNYGQGINSNAYGQGSNRNAYGQNVNRNDNGQAINRNALDLASLALSLPSAGSPIPTSIGVPQHASSSYSAPALLASAPAYGVPAIGGPAHASPATGASAAAAGSNVAPNSPRAAYAPVIRSGAAY